MIFCQCGSLVVNQKCSNKHCTIKKGVFTTIAFSDNADSPQIPFQKQPLKKAKRTKKSLPEVDTLDVIPAVPKKSSRKLSTNSSDGESIILDCLSPKDTTKKIPTLPC